MEGKILERYKEFREAGMCPGDAILEAFKVEAGC